MYKFINHIFLIYTFLILLLTPASGQEFTCQKSTKAKYIVTAPSGLNLREGPGINSKKLLAIPFQSEVWVCYTESKDPVVLEGKKGRWFNARFNGVEGYLFSGFLQLKKCLDPSGVSIIIPGDHLLDHQQIPVTCEAYLGLFNDNRNKPGYGDNYVLRPITLLDTQFVRYRQAYLGKIPLLEDQPLFLISGLRIENKEIKGRWMNERLPPFQVKQVWSSTTNRVRTQYWLYTEGNIIRNEDQEATIPFSQVKDYKVWIRIKEKGKLPREQLLYQNNLFYQLGFLEPSFALVWGGDLNGDNIPDLITKLIHTKGISYQIYLSNPRGSSQLYKVIDAGGGSCC